jgi:hypothetical protein
MASTPPLNPDETDRLLREAARGDEAALRSLLERHRERLRRIFVQSDCHVVAG